MTAREIAALFEDLELRLIASLKRNLARHKAEEKDEGFDWPAWQAEKLHSLQRFRRENKSIIAAISILTWASGKRGFFMRVILK